MSLYVASLNSGSNGNCYYIANEQEAILIDAGISCRETENRLKRLGLSMDPVRAIFITHEHTDHINGVEVLSKKYGLPVYINAGTLGNSGLNIDKKLRKTFRPYKPISIGKLSVTAFPKFHDAAEPCSFMVNGNEVNVGVMTDIGHACEDVIKNFKECHAVFLETNYDEEMLDKGSYPYHLKRRIKSNVGHLSNQQALELFVNHRSTELSHVFLSHLSKENNSPKLVEELFREYAGETEIIVASRYAETEIYQIKSGFVAGGPGKQIERKNYQMKLF